MRAPELPARVRLTVFYGALFLASGAVLIGLILAMVFAPSPSTRASAGEGKWLVQTRVADQAAPDAKQRARDELRTRLLAASGLALGAMTVVALGSGWVMAGRVLRPIRAVSSAARRLSERDLHERIPVTGPDDELKELAETFNEMIARLERAFTAQRLFAANASHELRGPMATQRILVDVALTAPRAGADVVELATNLREVLARQERLVDGLFELASSRHGPQRRERVALDAVVEEVVGRWRAPAADAGVDLVAERAPTSVVGDRVLVEVMVDNLVRNAVGHNHRGGLVRVRTAAGAVRVENTGPVLSAERVTELTEPFRRGGRDRTGTGAGAGLGLTIVDTIMAVHGGSLRLRAREGGGLVATAAFSLKSC
ncbi:MULTISPECIES: HAMP domain-containing protein [Saccharothrix]|uniref:HAMP domain-containing protein n=1 Tax=Saccharothrix TaxID=2071 RepID=UPI00093E868D|nr:HAMP domain-containing protein [Saccharothrix sp. CB00851]